MVKSSFPHSTPALLTDLKSPMVVCVQNNSNCMLEEERQKNGRQEMSKINGDSAVISLMDITHRTGGLGFRAGQK